MRLVRTGSPIVDVIPGLLRYDDRGSAFATWRFVPQFADTGEEWIIFKCVYVVEVDAAASQRDRADQIDPAMQERRLDRLAPPGRDDLPRQRLSPCYSPRPPRTGEEADSGSDTNLGSRPEVLQTKIPPERFADLVTGAAAASEKILLANITYQQHRLSALGRADRDVAAARTKLDRMRAGSRRLGEEMYQLDEDAALLEEELGLLATLTPRLDSIGLMFLAGERLK